MEILYLSGIIISVFLAFVLFTKSEKTAADHILACWLTASGLALMPVYLIETGLYLEYPTLLVICYPLPALQGVFLYLYIRYQTSPILFQKKDLLHFIPLCLIYLLFARFFALPYESKVAVVNADGAGYKTESLIRVIFIYLSGIIYIPLSLYRLLAFRKNLKNRFSSTEKINFKWLLYLIVGLSAIWIIVLLIREDRLIFSSTAVFIFWIGYFGINQVKVFSQKTIENIATEHQTGNHLEADAATGTPATGPAENAAPLTAITNKYVKSSLDKETAKALHTALYELLQTKKPYLEPELTLNDLAAMLDTSPNHLSQVINSIEQKSFYDLINERRVEAYLQLIKDPASKKYTLLTLAYDCGFNSKTSFNRNFKKYTGKTPSDYLSTGA